jgi:hypothetical protein
LLSQESGSFYSVQILFRASGNHGQPPEILLHMENWPGGVWKTMCSTLWQR